MREMWRTASCCHPSEHATVRCVRDMLWTHGRRAPDRGVFRILGLRLVLARPLGGRSVLQRIAATSLAPKAKRRYVEACAKRLPPPLRRALAAATVRLALAASALRSGVTAVYFRPAITTVVASGLDGGWWIRRVEGESRGRRFRLPTVCSPDDGVGGRPHHPPKAEAPTDVVSLRRVWPLVNLLVGLGHPLRFSLPLPQSIPQPELLAGARGRSTSDAGSGGEGEGGVGGSAVGVGLAATATSVVTSAAGSSQRRGASLGPGPPAAERDAAAFESRGDAEPVQLESPLTRKAAFPQARRQARRR
mmetsp:Transcript_46295/g.149216  ORF Transcript_46295/g.149216 Transcript_46295/m.149216 type:complete len:305 (+) Transcript_46295:403-1317(+)